jgi:hypothetical protein
MIYGLLPLLAGLLVLSSCGSDSPTGPVLGDLAFVPRTVDLNDHGRSAQVDLRNASQTALGPVVVGLGTNVILIGDPNELCDLVRATIVGSPTSVLAPGAEAALDITIDMGLVDLLDCPAGRYMAPFLASVSGKILATATIEFDWDGTLP